MSKTRKRVLSVLTILFAIALVFTACFALTGCGGDEGSTGDSWTEYKFDAKKGDATQDTNGNAYYFWIFSDGTSMFGTESDYNLLFTPPYMTSGTTGYWGYLDGTLTFVKASGAGMDYDDDGNMVILYEYYTCTTTTSGDSVTVTTPDSNLWSATITDIGCLAGATGYDLTSIEITA